jgi:hypothetical protein
MKKQDVRIAASSFILPSFILEALWVLGVRRVSAPCKCSLRLMFRKLRQTSW